MIKNDKRAASNGSSERTNLFLFFDQPLDYPYDFFQVIN